MAIEGTADNSTATNTNTSTSEVNTSSESTVNTNSDNSEVKTNVENTSEKGTGTNSEENTKASSAKDSDDEDDSYFEYTSDDEDDKKTETENKSSEPEKIKIGDKEYTPEEIKKAFEAQLESEKTKEPEPRPAQLIHQELQIAQKQCENDFESFKQRFVQKSMIDPASGYTADYLFQYGQQTGDFSAFISTLTPMDAIAFNNEKQQGSDKYDEVFGKYNTELQGSVSFERKMQDVKQFTDFKTKNDNFKDSPFLAHIYDNFISKNYGFDEKKLAEFMTAVQTAREFEAEQIAINTSTQDGKDRMLNSPANNGKTLPADKYGGIPRSWSAIYKKGQDFYNKNSQIIDEMDTKGLIKA